MRRTVALIVAVALSACSSKVHLACYSPGTYTATENAPNVMVIAAEGLALATTAMVAFGSKAPATPARFRDTPAANEPVAATLDTTTVDMFGTTSQSLSCQPSGTLSKAP